MIAPVVKQSQVLPGQSCTGGRHSALALLIPVLGRPHRVKPLLDSIRKATTEPWRVYFIHEPQDIEEINAIDRDAPAAGWLCVPEGTNYARKINFGARATDEPLIFTGADDLEFHPGWLEAALEVMERRGAEVIGTNDLCNPKTMRGEHATHFLVQRSYLERGTVDEPDKLLHEGYPHEYVDNEFFETAKARGVYGHALESLVEHLHPMVGKAPSDELYAGMPGRMVEGLRVYESRRHLWNSSAD